MSREQIIRMMAGFFILASLVLVNMHHENWMWLTAFVGLNLLQSSFTKWCPAEVVLKKMNIGH